MINKVVSVCNICVVHKYNTSYILNSVTCFFQSLVLYFFGPLVFFWSSVFLFIRSSGFGLLDQLVFLLVHISFGRSFEFVLFCNILASIGTKSSVKNINKLRARASDKLAISQTSSGNPYFFERIQEAFLFYYNMCLPQSVIILFTKAKLVLAPTIASCSLSNIWAIIFRPDKYNNMTM